MAASVEITGRPIVPTAMVLEEVFERGSLRGGTFTMASSTFAMTRVVTGQLDCHLDVGQRVRQAVPELEPLWRRAGDGRIIALYVYDLAGVQLVAREAGLTVTDAWGRSLDTALLTEVSEPHHLSCVTASNPKLHAALMDSIERGITPSRCCPARCRCCAGSRASVVLPGRRTANPEALH